MGPAVFLKHLILVAQSLWSSMETSCKCSKSDTLMSKNLVWRILVCFPSTSIPSHRMSNKIVNDIYLFFTYLHHIVCLCWQLAKEEKTWPLRAEAVMEIEGLVNWIKDQWEAMFGVKLITAIQ